MNKKVRNWHQTVGNTAHAVVPAGFALLSWQEWNRPPPGERATESYVPDGNGQFAVHSVKRGVRADILHVTQEHFGSKVSHHLYGITAYATNVNVDITS